MVQRLLWKVVAAGMESKWVMERKGGGRSEEIHEGKVWSNQVRWINTNISRIEYINNIE